MKKLKDIKAEAGTIREQVLKDSDGDVSYVKDVAERGCVDGNCRRLVYDKDTHNFYSKHADEINEILGEMEKSLGEPYNIDENMKLLDQPDLCNFLLLF